MQVLTNQSIFFFFLLSFFSVSLAFNKLVLEQLLPADCIILEAGAYDGGDTKEIAELLPNAHIYAFEPIPHLLSILKENTKECSNVHCFPQALSKQTGTATFYVSSVPGALSGSSSLLEPTEHLNYYPGVAFNSSLEVATVNLDEWAECNAIDHIDFMWLDMQGAELEMLKAAPKIIKKTKLIFLEVAYIPLYKGSHLFDEVCAWFESEGFTLVYEETNSQAEGNALFMRTA